VTEPGEADADLVRRLRAGDVDAFDRIVQAWSPAMLRVARAYVASHASAEDVVQETWLAVVRGLDGFAGRSSLRTWVFHILMNRARTHGQQESRVVPLPPVGSDETDSPTVDPARFQRAGDPMPGRWKPGDEPDRWSPSPEDATVAGEIRRLLAAALRALPHRQQMVVSLRDVHGMDSDETCEILGITPGNQRVLLHRGRARLRAALEDYYRGTWR
jgi:RNA polymerase sigma-70 factor (ECF subfamily)